MATKKFKPLAQTEPKVTATKKNPAAPLGFAITSEFHGYRSREDVTNLPAGYLVPPSQNVIVNTAGLVQSSPGYTLDGQAGTSGNPILGSFDFIRGSFGNQHLRSGNSKLQYRYVASAGDKWSGNTFTAGQVYWIDLKTSLNSGYVNFTPFWDTTELINVVLFVDRESFIYEWSGAVTTLASTGGSGPSSFTLTKTGTTSWAQAGFYTAKSGRAVVINGNTYTYTGGESTTTLTGVSGDPTAEPANSVVHQAVVSTANSSTTSLPSAFRNDLIGKLGNQVYVASLLSNNIYISKINNYKDYSQSTPRQPGEGYVASVDGLVNAIAVQESTMYASWGDSGWTTIVFTLSSDLTHEAVTFTPLKTAPLQAALSQGLLTSIGNDLAFVTNEPTFSTLGRVSQTITTPQITNMSDPIKNDMDSYTVSGFADGQSFYTNYFVYVSLPTLNIVRRYNISQGWWEAPFILPVGRFSFIDGSLYGHSYQTDETYKLFNGMNANGNPIHSIAAFSYQNFEQRVDKKRFEEWYVEGYISANTTLSAIAKFDFGGFSGMNTGFISGSDSKIIFQTSADGSLGRNPIGLEPIGSVTDSILNLPKFRVILTGQPTAFYEYQPYFETNDIDYQWALLAHGPRIQQGPAPSEIRE